VHAVVDGQATEVRVPIGGAVRVCQLAPASVVVTMAAVREGAPPTAVHIVTDGQATDERSDTPAGTA
jgi:hypothetical protein